MWFVLYGWVVEGGERERGGRGDVMFFSLQVRWSAAGAKVGCACSDDGAHTHTHTQPSLIFGRQTERERQRQKEGGREGGSTVWVKLVQRTEEI
jgi:hypothetical protein